MDRRGFLKTTGLATTAAAVGTAASSPARAVRPHQAPEIVFHAACAWSTKATRLNDIADRFAQTVSEASNGRIAVSLAHTDTATNNKRRADLTLRIPDVDDAALGTFGAAFSGIPLSRPIDANAQANWLMGAGAHLMIDRTASERGRKLLTIGQTLPASGFVAVEQPGSESAAPLPLIASGPAARIFSAVDQVAQASTSSALLDHLLAVPQAVSGQLSLLDLALARPGLPVAADRTGLFATTGMIVTADWRLADWMQIAPADCALIETAATGTFWGDHAAIQAFSATVWPHLPRPDANTLRRKLQKTFAALPDWSEAAKDTLADLERSDSAFAGLLASLRPFQHPSPGTAAPFS